MKDNDYEWWQKRATQGIKFLVDNWLYSNDKIYEESIWKELEDLCLDKMIDIELCKYCGALFGSFRHAVFEYVFKNKILPTVNSENTIVEEEDKTYHEMVTKKVFGQKLTKNHYMVIQAILHNLFDPEIVKIKFDKRYLTRKLQSFLCVVPTILAYAALFAYDPLPASFGGIYVAPDVCSVIPWR
ncbi:11295_t:CDS:2 [Racocetra persica]|uniref:11295_t:CDS:1 n=1 Tax=Racocetra persica TaxID=160502 RepID=A0ACA9LEP1_9GLOM|nr:11295_t:CDS:2 [Racocetra persica]